METSMLIYIATPYSGNEEANYKKACHVCANIVMATNFAVFSPIVHWHRIAQEYKLATDAEYWWYINREYLHKADVLMVIQMKGWKDSKGIAQEIEYAKELGKKIRYITVDEKFKMGIDEFKSDFWELK
jgi:hypothetical protein